MEMRSRSPLYTSSTGMHMGRHDLASLHPVRCSRGAGTDANARGSSVPRRLIQWSDRPRRGSSGPVGRPVHPPAAVLFSRWAAQHANDRFCTRRRVPVLSPACAPLRTVIRLRMAARLAFQPSLSFRLY